MALYKYVYYYYYYYLAHQHKAAGRKTIIIIITCGFLAGSRGVARILFSGGTLRQAKCQGFWGIPVL